jgi:hypothetical protein
MHSVAAAAQIKEIKLMRYENVKQTIYTRGVFLLRKKYENKLLLCFAI